MAKLVDPDSLTRDTEIVFDTTDRTIQLLVAGNLNDGSPGQTSGVTLQCVYSKCKELWKTETDLNKLKFPFDAITEVKMDLVNGWSWEDAQTRELLRDGGWSQRNAAGLPMEEYATIISLGLFSAITDQAYYQGVFGFNQASPDFAKTGVLNEAIETFAEGTTPAGGIQIDVVAATGTFTRTTGDFLADGFVVGETIVTRGFTNGGNNTTKVIQSVVALVITVTDVTGLADETGDADEQVFHDYRGFLKAYLRIGPSGDPLQGRSYSQGNLLADQGLAALDYTVYRMPLSNAVDIKVTHTDAYVEGNTPYTGMVLDFINGALYATWLTSTDYYVDDVVQDPADDRWYRCITEHTSGASRSADAAKWEAYPGERQIGDDYFAFNRIVDGNTGDLEQIYEFCQHELRQSTNINDDVGGDGYGTILGRVAVPLNGFLGDTLQSNPGTFIDDFDPNDTNRIQMFDITVDGGGVDSEGKPVTTTKRTFPFVAAGNLVFNDELLNDDDVVWKMYFLDLPGANDYDTVNAVVVNDADGQPITGSNPSAAVPFTFDYDGNVQGGRTPGEPAAVVVAAIGLDGAQFVVAQFTITAATGLTFPVNAAKERNYSNPA